MKKIQAALLFGAALLLVPAIARAQFRGDVFFAAPSVAVPEGGTGVMEILVFSGADVVGAAHVDVVFDPAAAEVVAVQPSTTPQLANGLASALSPGRAGVVSLNGSSLQQPFGTVSLGRVQVRPLIAAGNRVLLSLQVRSLLRQDSIPFSSARGFSGEILVVSSASSLTVAADTPPPAAPDDSAVQRALAFRPPGLAVDLLDFETRGGMVSAVPRRVVVADPEAPSEAPLP